MQNKASMNESKYSEQFYAQGEDGKDYQIEIELEDGPNAEDPEKITVVLNGERKTVDVPKGGTDDHYKKAIAAGLKEHGKYKLMEGKIPDVNEGKYPQFIKIESEDDYKNYVVPALGNILEKGYEFNDIKDLWFELDEDQEKSVPKNLRKTMRQILKSEGADNARFLYSYSDRIDNPLASEYVQGMDAEWYGVKEDDFYESKAGKATKKPLSYKAFKQQTAEVLCDTYNYRYGPADLLTDGDYKGIVWKCFDAGKSPEDTAKELAEADDMWNPAKANEATKKPLYVYIGYSGSWGDGDDEKTKLPAGDNYLDIVSKHFDTKPEEIDAKWRKKLENCKTDADFGKVLAAMYDAMEAFVFALRRGNECVWSNPKGSKELNDKDWQGPDYDWLTANV